MKSAGQDKAASNEEGKEDGVDGANQRHPRNQTNRPSEPAVQSSWNSLHSRSALPHSRAWPMVHQGSAVSPTVSPVVSSRNAGSVIVPPASGPSARELQSRHPADGVGPRPREPLIESTDTPLFGGFLGTPLLDPCRRQVWGNGSPDLGTNRDRVAAGSSSIDTDAYGRQVEQRRVRPCLSMSPSTVSAHPRATRDQTTGPTSSSMVFGHPQTEKGQTNAPMSPCTVSGPSTAVPDQTRRGDPFGSLATGVQPRVLAMDVTVTVSDPAEQSTRDRDHESSPSFAGPAGGGSPRAGALRRDEAKSSRDKLSLSRREIQWSQASGVTTCASTVTGGRPKGTSRGKSCHGCRTTEQKVKEGIKMKCNNDEACKYWLCLGCFTKWKDKSGLEGFLCCLHEGNGWCPCQNRYHPATDVRPSTLDQPVQAKKDAVERNIPEHANKGAVGTTIFKLPTPTTATSPTAALLAPSHTRVPTPGGSTVYSVCTSLSPLRVAVVKTGAAFMCSQRYCRCVETLSSAAITSAAITGGITYVASPAHCPHTEVVRQQEASPAPMPEADAVFSGAEFERALDRVPAGIFNDDTLQAMRQRTDHAQKEEVPLLVGMGDTNWFAVREGAKINDDEIGEWAHVKWERDSGSNLFQCKANNGHPCSESLSRKTTGRCVHAAIVAVHISNQYREQLEQDEPMGDVNLRAGDGPRGVEEGDAGDVGFASHTQREDPVRFNQQVAMLRMIMSIYKFPVEEPSLNKEAYGRDRIRMHGRVCLGCGRAYDQLPDSNATLLAQGPRGADLRVVKLEQRECKGCNLKGWAGDDIYEDGVFNYNGDLVIEVRVLYQLRSAVRDGIPAQNWVRTFLRPRLSDIRWLRSQRNRTLTSRIADDGFYEVVHEAYLAFEALSQHPYDFVSYLHGHNPELLCMNESAEIATDESCIAQFEVARVDRYVDTDLQHALVILSMISKMVFRFRLRWVTEAAPIFGPHNRVSNLILRTQRGKMAPEGSPESGDARELARALGDGTISDLSGKTFCELKTIYRLCFPSEKGIGRYPDQGALVRCFEDLWESSGGGAVGQRCSKPFTGRPSGITTGVGELFAPDGVVCAHVFQLVAESPADAVDMIAHLMVQPCLLTTDEPCTVAPIAEKLYPGLLENAGALPRNAEGEVSLAGLQHLGTHVHQFPDEHHVKRPAEDFPSTFAPSASGAAPNAYAVFARADASRAIQVHVDFHALLGRAAAFQEQKRQTEAAATADGGAGGVGDASSSPARMCELAKRSLKSLHSDGRFAMSLFEVVLVYALWFQAAGHEGVDAGQAVAEASVEERGADGIPQERAIKDLSNPELLSISSFFMGVLRVAVGSIAQTPGLDMEAPDFFTDDTLFDLEQSTGDTAIPLRRLEDVVKLFHEEKVSYITDRLGAADDRLRERARGLVRAGVGFGVAEHSVKALQMALSQDSLGGGVDEDGRVPGYSISFNFKRNRSFGEVGHFYAGQRVGLWLGPDGPHERNHQGPCQAKYGGLTRCPQLAGVDCGVDVYGRSKKPKDTSGVSGMGLDALIFDVTLVNELDNADINRELCNLAVTRAIEHPHDRLHACCSEVWICGRCFCSSPLMRSFDKSGKLRLTRTWQER